MKRTITTLLLTALFATTIGLCGCHSHKYTKTKVPPTCIDRGYTLNSCSCGVSFKEYYTSYPSGHKLSDWIIETEATCTKNGKKYKKCTVCEDTFSQEIPASHKASDWIIETEATCTKNGNMYRKCNVCGKITDYKILWASHKFDNDTKCTSCGTIHPEYPYIEIPQTPTIKIDYSYSKKIDSKCNILSIEKKYSSRYIDITFTIEKTYDAQGDLYSRPCKFGYKVYDKDDIVVKSGTVFTESIKVGEKTKETITIFSTEAGKEYKLVLLNTD